jgi:Fic family protein
MSHQKVDMLKRIYDKNYDKEVRISKNLQGECAYHHHALEGNTLSLPDVKRIVVDGVAIGNKTLTEHFEILNYVRAMDYLHTQPKLNEQVLKKVHSMLTEHIKGVNGGTYRKNGMTLPNSDHIPPPYQFLQTEMIRLFEWYEKTQEEHPIDRAVIFHCRLVEIQPFTSGNALLSKLILHFLLIQAHYPCMYIPIQQKEEYTAGMEKALVEKDYSFVIPFIAKRIEGSLAKQLLVV